MNKIHAVIPIFIPHKGCPHDCIFCNQKKISGQTKEMSIIEMRHIIESHLETLNSNSLIEIGFYGGSFTGIEEEKQIEYLSAANEYIKSGKVLHIRLSTRPDYINSNILGYLKHYNVKTIELGVQSMDQEILDASCRGHSKEDIVRSSRLIKENGFNLGIQTMIGLPLDTWEKDLHTAKKVIELAPSIVRIYPALVIKGTYLEKMMQDGKYTPIRLNEAVEICSELLEMYEDNNINVIRIGLQPSDNISEGSEIAAGPFHPAFRQLVEAKLTLKRMEEIINKLDLSSSSVLIVRTGNNNISNVVGQNKENIKYLNNKYGIGKIKVEGIGKNSKEILINIIDK